MKKSNLFYEDVKQEDAVVLSHTAELEILLMYLYTKTNCKYSEDFRILVDMVKDDEFIICSNEECDSIVKDYILYFTINEDNFLKDFISMMPPYIKDFGDRIYNDYYRSIYKNII